MKTEIKQMLFPRLMGLVLIQLVALTSSTESFRILALMASDGESHWKFVEPVFEELAKRGNNVTVVGHFPRKIPTLNYHDISIADDANPSLNSKDMEAIVAKYHFATMMDFLQRGVEDACRKALQHPNVQRLIKSEEKFDVIITEIFHSDCFLGFVYKFDTPHVGLRTAAPSPWVNDRITNPDNPSYIPISLMGKSTRMNFFERVENFLASWIYKILYRHYDKVCTEIARESFGKEMPPLEEIANRVSMILTNTHFVSYMARPLVPGMKEIGGVHMPENKPLPADLENWISGAAHGAVYFSLGSMLRTESLSLVKRKAFFDAFAALPQRVLMKWEGNQTEGLPGNVRTVKWSPQFDVISHPNVKAFIYHGGMLGITEAVYAGIPMIVIPVYGDQLTNAALLEEKGFAVVLRNSEITKETLLTALEKVLHEPSYKKTAKLMSAAIRDRLVSPLDEAVYWIEYVARHQGAPWLRTPAHGMPLYQYLLLDVVGFLIVVLLLLVLVTWLIVRRLSVLFLKRIHVSVKKFVKNKKKLGAFESTEKDVTYSPFRPDIT